MAEFQKTDDEFASVRLRFPDDEPRFPWLSMLLDAYAIIDTGVDIAVTEEEGRRNVNLACKKGCDICCRSQKDIPVYPLELVGIYWFCAEKIVPPEREILKNQLLSHGRGDPCPFLLNNLCCIYPLRVVSCRQFNVFGRLCGEGEDPYHIRGDDVLTPIQDYTDRAFLTMLPFYGVTDEAEKIRVIKSGLIHTQVDNLQSYDWQKLVRAMENFDSKLVKKED